MRKRQLLSLALAGLMVLQTPALVLAEEGVLITEEEVGLDVEENASDQPEDEVDGESSEGASDAFEGEASDEEESNYGEESGSVDIIEDLDSVDYATDSNVVTITFDSNGCSLDTQGDSQTHVGNRIVGTYALNDWVYTPVASDYDKYIVGWSTDPNGNNIVIDLYQDGFNWPTANELSGSTTLYAVVRDAVHVEFDFRGGKCWDQLSGSYKGAKGYRMMWGDTPELNDTSKVFIGWTDKLSNTTNPDIIKNYMVLPYDNNIKEYKPDSDTKLYAVYGDKAQVSFNLKGGTINGNSTYSYSAVKGYSYDASFGGQVYPERTDGTFAFLGWATSDSATYPNAIKNYNVMQNEPTDVPYVVEGDRTLYAVWSDDPQYLNGNQGQGNQGSQALQMPVDFNGGHYSWDASEPNPLYFEYYAGDPINYCLPDGYAWKEDEFFLGWYGHNIATDQWELVDPNIRSIAGNTWDYDNTIIIVDDYDQLQARYSENYSTIVYEANGGHFRDELDWVYAEFDFENGATENPENEEGFLPTKAGDTFLGWSTTPNATEPDAKYSTEFTVTNNLTLYAVYESARDNQCNHTWGAWTQVRPATTTETGLNTRICSKCGAVDEDILPVLVHTHSFGAWTVTRQATALQTGLETRTCACGEKEERDIAKLKATIQMNATSVPLKVRQKTSAVKVTLTAGDSVASWTSSNTAIATVDANGVITAGKKAGTATITATTKAGAVAAFTVKVQKKAVKATQITGLNKSETLKVGAQLQLAPVVYPITVTSKAKFSSSNKKVATVNKNGVITAKKPGTAKIKVKVGNKTFTVKVTVPKPVISNVPATVTLKVGQTLQLSPSVEPATLNGKVKYSTSKKRVARVSKTGVIKAKKKGKATITLTVNGTKKKVKVTVVK